jgi:hypothetical protein
VSYDYRSAMGRADSPRTGCWGVLLVALLLAVMVGTCVWAAM